MTLNSAALVAATHRRFGKAADGTSTRELTYMINKWRARIKKKGIYNVRSPLREGDSFFGKPREGGTKEGKRTTSSSDESRGQHFTL